MEFPARHWVVLRLGLAIAGFVAGLALILVSTSTSVYGFAVSADPILITERGFQVGPLLTALATMTVIGLLDRRLAWVRADTGSEPVAGQGHAIGRRLLANALILAVLYTILTVAVIALIIGRLGGEGLPFGTIPLIPGYVFDVVLVMIFVQFLHALTRRSYLTLSIFVGYVALVLFVGRLIGSVDLIGFGTTSPVSIVRHDAWPIGLEAAWWGRLYWCLVTLVMGAVLFAFYDPPQPLLGFHSATFDRRGPVRTTLVVIGGLIVAAALTGHTLSAHERAIAARYPAIADILPAGVTPFASRPTLIGFDIAVDAGLAQRRIAINGLEAVRNDTKVPISIVALEKAQVLRLTDVALPGARRWWIGKGGRMILITLDQPLRAGETRTIRYRGLIDASDSFDTAARLLVMPHAFFLKTASVLPLPRRPACFAGPSYASACNKGENYMLADTAAGRVTVMAPADLVVPAGRRSSHSDGRVRSVVMLTSRSLSNMLISASRYRVVRIAASMAAPAITVYGAPYGHDPLGPIGRYASGAFHSYAPLWDAAPLRDFWIAETPPGLFEATAYGDGLAISERYFGRRMRGSASISEATQMILSHEIAHQWWGYTVVPAKAPGSAFILESFAQFAGLARLYQSQIVDRRTLIAREQANVATGISRTGVPTTPLYTIEGTTWRAYHEGPLALMRLDQRIGGTLVARMGAVFRNPVIAGGQPADPAAVVAALIDEIPEQSRDRTKRALAAAR